MAEKRKQVSTRTRFNIFKRDGFQCQYCGRTPPMVVLEVDHIKPVCEGGTNHQDNLVTSCFDCNRGKAGVSLGVIPQSLNDKAKEIDEREKQLAGYRKIMDAMLARKESDSWTVAHTFMDYFGLTEIRRDWFLSIGKFVDKIGVYECVEAMEIAANKKGVRTQYNVFRYFCGVCWKKIKDGDNHAKG